MQGRPVTIRTLDLGADKLPAYQGAGYADPNPALGLRSLRLSLRDPALFRVQLRVEPRTWEAFRLTAIEGIPAAEVAGRLGKKVATIYVSRSNVQKMLRDEIGSLESGAGGGAAVRPG